MAILTRAEIKRQVEAQRLFIDDFDESRLNPNSYNLRLDLYSLRFIHPNAVLDAARKSEAKFNELAKLEFIEDAELGITKVRLMKNVLYLGATIEKTFSPYYAPMIVGRSSLARLGVSVHQTAGFGDIGFNGHWTLEFTCTNDTFLYDKMEIAQIYFFEPVGDYAKLYNGKYQNNNGVQTSKLYEEFDSEKV